MRLASTIIILVLLFTCAFGQTTGVVDISDVANAGAIIGNRYVNSYLGLAIDTSQATLKKNTLVMDTGQRARLFQALSDHLDWDHTYTFAVLADRLSVNPLTHTPMDYVKNLSRGTQSDGFVVIREPFQTNIVGTEFAAVVLANSEGRRHYRGIYTCFRRGYILSFDVEAASPDKLTELVSRSVKFEN